MNSAPPYPAYQTTQVTVFKTKVRFREKKASVKLIGILIEIIDGSVRYNMFDLIA